MGETSPGESTWSSGSAFDESAKLLLTKSNLGPLLYITHFDDGVKELKSDVDGLLSKDYFDESSKSLAQTTQEIKSDVTGLLSKEDFDKSSTSLLDKTY